MSTSQQKTLLGDITTSCQTPTSSTHVVNHLARPPRRAQNGLKPVQRRFGSTRLCAKACLHTGRSQMRAVVRRGSGRLPLRTANSSVYIPWVASRRVVMRLTGTTNPLKSIRRQLRLGRRRYRLPLIVQQTTITPRARLRTIAEYLAEGHRGGTTVRLQFH